MSSEIKPKPLAWFGIAKNPKANNRLEQEYCEFCLNNFKRYYQLINNVCTSCGRTPRFITEVNQQAETRLTAISDKLENNNDNIYKGVSMDVDYSEMLNNDDTTQAHNDRMVARSAGEAIRVINNAEKQSSKYYQSLQSPIANLQFRVKTVDDKNRKSKQDTEL